jgi:GT2 family glycosyltransferase
MSEFPVVGVCIPVHTEADAIGATVGSVFAVDYPREQLRVVVAVDGGDPAAAAAARAAGATVVEVVPNQGSYAARNAAIAALPDDVTAVLFTDADCLVSPQWVTAHLAALADAPLTGGGVDFRFARERPNPTEWVDSIRHLQQRRYVEQDGFAATCNLAMRRDVLDVVRFDPTLRTGGDADFCLRAKAEGFALAYAPDARISHPARRSRRELLTKVRRIASGAPRVRALQGSTRRPQARLSLGPYSTARTAGYRVGPVWAVRACLLDFTAQRIRARAFADKAC